MSQPLPAGAVRAPTSIEEYSPFKLHSLLEELKQLATCAYITLSEAKGNKGSLDAGIYTLCLVTSKLDDLTFHYQRLVEERESTQPAGRFCKHSLEAFHLINDLPETQRERVLSGFRGVVCALGVKS